MTLSFLYSKHTVQHVQAEGYLLNEEQLEMVIFLKQASQELLKGLLLKITLISQTVKSDGNLPCHLQELTQHQWHEIPTQEK